MRGLVDLHLRPADAERPQQRTPSRSARLVGRLDALDARRGDGVEVDQRLSARATTDRTDSRQERRPPPRRRRRSTEAPARPSISVRFAEVEKAREWLADHLRRSIRPRPGPARVARADGDLRPQPGEEPRDPLADRPGAASTATSPLRPSRPNPSSTARTAAAAVVFEPLGSNRTETRNGPKKVDFTASSTASAPPRPSRRRRSPSSGGRPGPG